MKALKNPASLIGIAAVAGIVFGLVVGEWAANLAFVGTMFIRLIQMSIVPLVMASVIVATGSMTGSGMGRLAGRTFRWMLRFSAVAALLAFGLAALIRPGAGMVYTGQLDPRWRRRRPNPPAGRTPCSVSFRRISSTRCRRPR